jgi:hypothetical protein
LSNRKKKIVVYTAISENYDELREPKYISKNCDYVCFTDDMKLKSKIWDIVPIENWYNDPRRNVRRYKILPHLYFSDYEYSIWIDGCVDIVDDIKPFIDLNLGDASIACFKHRHRNCIYDEANACIRLKKDNEDIIKRQIWKYKSIGYPQNNGLIESGILVRRHNDPDVIKLMEDWWNEISKSSIRDQISFNFVAWKNKTKYNIIDENIRETRYFKCGFHNNQERLEKYDIVSCGLYLSKCKIKNIGCIKKDTRFIQEFYSPKANLNGIYLYISTYRQKIVTPYKLIIKDENRNHIIREVNLDIHRIKDNSFFDIMFDPILDSKGKKYCFTITPAKYTVNTPITLALGEDNNYKDRKTILNGVTLKKAIFHNLIYSKV